VTFQKLINSAYTPLERRTAAMTSTTTISAIDFAGYTIPRLGLGCMALSIEGRPAYSTAVATIHSALDAGVRYLDTAWSYYLPRYSPQSHNNASRLEQSDYGERLVHEAVTTWDGPQQDVLIASKIGWSRTVDQYGTYGWQADARPETIIAQAKESAQRLGVESLGLLYSHCDDPNVPYEDQMGAFRQLVDEGVARTIGISRVDNHNIDVAHHILGKALVAVQNQFSPSYPDPLHTMDHCKALNLAFVCWSPLGGFLDPVDAGAYDAFKKVAQRRGISYQRVVLAWELSRCETLITIPSARNPHEIQDSFAATQLLLTEEELSQLP
jgi:aryl-alcohol dehydrogenase-like predicted oxidoreductase